MHTRSYAYIMSSRSRTLYIGVTNDLKRRIAEHKEGLFPGFTSKYRITSLVYYEIFTDIRDAIQRETQLKGWRRERKIRLIESLNHSWEDLGDKI
jgi:putative endonuclease